VDTAIQKGITFFIERSQVFIFIFSDENVFLTFLKLVS